MENYITEVVAPFCAPSSDARLVVFADDSIREDPMDALKYLMRCSQYALRFKVYLVSGLLVHDGNLCLSLFNPRGKAICRQPALHLALSMQGLLTEGDEVQVVPTDLGNFYLCVDEDICHPQTVRAAALKGADTVISVRRIDPIDSTPDNLLLTAWNASQSNNVYVVSVSCTGVAVTCPSLVTRARDGYLVRQSQTRPVRFGLNMERLDQVRDNLQIMQNINTSLVQRYAPELGGLNR